jgi:Ca2+-binding RTX toxin-like protein
VYVLDGGTDTVIEAASGGTDTVRAAGTMTLAANVEHLVLTGGGAVNGTGNGGANRLTGGAGANLLSGLAGNDTLDGGAGADTLVGGAGADVLTGGAGADLFRFLALGDSSATLAGRDRILDFSVADADRIDVSAIDADPTLAGDQAFVLLGGDDFTGTPGEIMVIALATTRRIDFDVNGDGLADFAITVSGTPNLTAAQFIL